MRLYLVRAQAKSLHHLTGKDRITVLVIYQVWQDLDVARLLPVPFLPSKNVHRITPFLDTRRDAPLVPIEAPWGRDIGADRQTLPGEDGMDGFFYVPLQKAEGPNFYSYM
jgi:hypothetical protein